MRHRLQSLLREVGAPALGVLVLAAIFFLMNGAHPGSLFAQMFSDAFGGAFSLSQTLLNAVTILLCGLAVSLPARLGLINVGAEGEMIAGAIAGTAIILWMPSAPFLLLMPLMTLAAMAGGAIWGAIIGAGRAYFNVNETIASLMLNFVAADFLEYLINGPWEAPGSGNWPTSDPYPPNAMPPVFTFAKVQVNASVMLALIAVAGLFFWFTYTRGGLIARFLLHNPRLARFAQIPAQRWTLIVMALAGIFPALAGIYQSTLVEGRLQAGFYEGYMMGGFVAAWIARNDFVALVATSLLLGGLFSAADALQLDANLPASTGIVIEALIIVVVLLLRTPKRITA
ncbi:MAG: ABC transporter permease [Candidatus Binataceae bacterium]|jgi:simple sugar transport system permease protein